MLYGVVIIYSWQLPEGFFLGIQNLKLYHFIPDFISKGEVIVKERWLLSKVWNCVRDCHRIEHVKNDNACNKPAG